MDFGDPSENSTSESNGADEGPPCISLSWN
jgi:hypothetical protein